ncbi:MAG: Gfo/Idh/MocA family oxidoreductase [Chloroflexia bacterium]|nr:Gfo/Idh/MocA family oxidoreductase [Chloroflexia bacterium]
MGAGGFGRSWVELAATAEGYELVAVVDPDPAARAWVASTLGLPPDRLFADLGTAFAATDPEAVLLVTPPETHHPLGLQALAAGKHVLMEKPLATSVGDGAALVAAAAAADRVLMVSQNYRHRAPARAVQAAIRDGMIGPLVHLRIAFRRQTSALWPPDNFRYAMRHPLVVDMTIHHADLLRMVTGQEAVALEARGWRVPGSAYEHDPAVAALISLSGGASVLYEGDWASPSPETSWNGDWEILGEAGVIRWTGGVANPHEGEVTLQRRGEPARPLPLPAVAHVDRAGSLAAFRRAVETGEEPETSGRDNLGSLEIVLAMVAAIERAETPAVS